MTKAILYYTHNSLPIQMEEFFQKRLLDSANGIPIISVYKKSRSEFSTNFAHSNILYENVANNWTSIHGQMQAGIDRIKEIFGDDIIVYLAEHDVLYPESYFTYTPDNRTTFLKNKNLFFLTKNGYMGPHNTYIHSQTIGYVDLFDFCLKEEVTDLAQKFKTQKDYKLKLFSSEIPSIDVRHGYNWTGDRKSHLSNYDEYIEYWGHYKELILKIPEFKLL